MAGRHEIVDRVAARTAGDGGTRAQASAAVDAVLAEITAALAAGERVTLTGFGTFDPVPRPERSARNPRTGAAVTVAATTVARFRAGAGLRAAVAGRAPSAAAATSRPGTDEVGTAGAVATSGVGAGGTVAGATTAARKAGKNAGKKAGKKAARSVDATAPTSKAGTAKPEKSAAGTAKREKSGAGKAKREKSGARKAKSEKSGAERPGSKHGGKAGGRGRDASRTTTSARATAR